MTERNSQSDKNQQFAIRFGLGAIKSVGLSAMQEATLERKKNGKFKDLYDFAERVDAKFVNKKSIEALAKSGSFDSLHKNRQQVAMSYEILSSYGAQIKEQKSSNQMSLFGGVGDNSPKPELKKIVDWNKQEKLQMEFEAFGFFLNEHPLDINLSELKKRGVIFSSRLEEGDLLDNSLIKMAGVVASSKHRSGSRGRFAYLYLSDPFGIFETTIFDEAIITNNRDLLNDGCEISVECLLKKGEGGTRLMIRSVQSLSDFIASVKPKKEEFEDVKILPNRQNFDRNAVKNSSQNFVKKQEFPQNSANQNKLQSSQNDRSNPAKDQKDGIRTDNFLSKSFDADGSEISVLSIQISEKAALLPLKTILLQKQEKRDGAKKTKIHLMTSKSKQEKGDELTKIELSGDFFLSEIDIYRFKNLHQSIKIIH